MQGVSLPNKVAAFRLNPKWALGNLCSRVLGRELLNLEWELRVSSQGARLRGSRANPPPPSSPRDWQLKDGDHGPCAFKSITGYTSVSLLAFSQLNSELLVLKQNEKSLLRPSSSGPKHLPAEPVASVPGRVQVPLRGRVT